MKYSKVQYILWLISGSEISALKNCPNDYNRHANIGLMILITSSFAGFFAYIAASTFVNSNFGSSLFAVVWAILIFALDRSMVNSIKRNPYSVEDDFWKVFSPRLVLAFVLAFFMSIPVDHIVFKERILKQIDENNHNDWLSRKKELEQGLNVKGSEKEVNILTSEIGDLQKELDSGCPLPEYKEILAEYNSCISIESQKKDSYNRIRDRVNNVVAQRKSEQNTETPQYNSDDLLLFSRRKDLKKEWGNQANDCKILRDSANKIDTRWKTNKSNELASIKTNLVESKDKLRKDSKEVANNRVKLKERTKFVIDWL